MIIRRNCFIFKLCASLMDLVFRASASYRTLERLAAALDCTLRVVLEPKNDYQPDFSQKNLPMLASQPRAEYRVESPINKK